MDDATTVGALLEAARRRIDRHDAEWLLAHALGKPRSWLFAFDDRAVDAGSASRFDALVRRREAGEPVAYLTGRRGFWTFELAVSPATLVPRPETERLVELALQRLPADRPLHVADLGTGSGAIALALASERPLARVIATDASSDALDVARANARALQLDNVEFRQGDWFGCLHGERFDLVASNPPYIAAGDPHLDDLRHEPAAALASGADGLDAIRRIVADAPAHLGERGWLLLEHGWNQGVPVRALLAASGFTDVTTQQDLEGRERVTLGRIPQTSPSRREPRTRPVNLPSAAEELRMRTLYPDLEPFDSGTLRVDARHTLYYEQCGNPGGKPVVVLHGGPGAGCNAKMRRFHDPAKYRIVLFDQRGSGRSAPHADLVDNTTWHLVDDIEQLRTQLGIERWQVFGGSWGSTLALAYAETHPQRVTELVLRGIFMLRRWELEWFYQQGASRLFPDAWEHYLEPIPPVERHDLISAFHRRLTSDDAATRLAAARAWAIWEGATSYLHIDKDYAASHGDEQFALAFARIENHYFVNGGFFEVEDQLLRDAHRIAGIPGVIVHGRYDVVCPIQNAWDLHRAWPKAQLFITPGSGHSAFEAENIDALVRATDAFAG